MSAATTTFGFPDAAALVVSSIRDRDAVHEVVLRMERDELAVTLFAAIDLAGKAVEMECQDASGPGEYLRYLVAVSRMASRSEQE